MMMTMINTAEKIMAENEFNNAVNHGQSGLPEILRLYSLMQPEISEDTNLEIRSLIFELSSIRKNFEINIETLHGRATSKVWSLKHKKTVLNFNIEKFNKLYALKIKLLLDSKTN